MEVDFMSDGEYSACMSQQFGKLEVSEFLVNLIFMKKGYGSKKLMFKTDFENLEHYA